MDFHPATPDRWNDVVELFGPNGAYSGCWCMWNRQTNAEFDQQHGEQNRRALHALVQERPPGILAYQDAVPVGWVSLGPYEDFSRLGRSPVAKPTDDTPVWAITCFVVARGRRGEGIATALLEAATSYAAAAGAAVLEAYPLDQAEKTDNAAAWMGLASMFEAAGFEEIARRRPTRPVVRKVL